MHRKYTPIGYTKRRFFGIEEGFDLHPSACGRTRRSCAECASNGSRNQHWYRDKYGALHGTRCGMQRSTTNDAVHGAAHSTRYGPKPTVRPSASIRLLIRLVRTQRTRQTQPSLRSDRLDSRSPSRFLRKRYHAFVFFAASHRRPRRIGLCAPDTIRPASRMPDTKADGYHGR